MPDFTFSGEDADALLRELTADALKAEHCPQCFDNYGGEIVRRLLTRTDRRQVTPDDCT